MNLAIEISTRRRGQLHKAFRMSYMLQPPISVPRRAKYIEVSASKAYPMAEVFPQAQLHECSPESEHSFVTGDALWLPSIPKTVGKTAIWIHLGCNHLTYRIYGYTKHHQPLVRTNGWQFPLTAWDGFSWSSKVCSAEMVHWEFL